MSYPLLGQKCCIYIRRRVHAVPKTARSYIFPQSRLNHKLLRYLDSPYKLSIAANHTQERLVMTFLLSSAARQRVNDRRTVLCLNDKLHEWRADTYT